MFSGTPIEINSLYLARLTQYMQQLPETACKTQSVESAIGPELFHTVRVESKQGELWGAPGMSGYGYCRSSGQVRSGNKHH